MTRAEYHADSGPTNVSSAKDVLARILRHAEGEAAAYTAKELSDATKEAGHGIEPTTIRDSVIELRRDYGLPVVGKKGVGYFIPDTENAVYDALNAYQEEIITKRKRQHELQDAWREWTD